MSRILLVWELGLGLGHTGRLLPLAAALARRGHEPVLAVKDLTAIGPSPSAPGYRVVQAPIWLHEVGGLPPPVSMAETLIRYGFHAPRELAAMAAGWRNLVELVAPDLILFDHAPVALLATRGMPILRAVYGDGFCQPPAVDPLPPYRWWLSHPASRLVDSTRHVLNAANEALAMIGAPPLATLADLYQADESFLLALPELDHYPERPGARYWGPVFSQGGGAQPHWPLTGSGRVFAYVSPSAPWFAALMEALKTSGASVLVFAPGVAARTARAASGPTMTVSSEPYDMAQIRAGCDAAVTQSGMGTACALLLAGKPQLMVPQFMERTMLAKRIESLGAGILLPPDNASHDFRRALKRLLGDAGLAEAARAFAARHPGFDPGQVIERVADRCVELVGTPPRPLAPPTPAAA